jgi:hypothetical protein
MKTIIKDAYHETIVEIKKIIPTKFQIAYANNKKKVYLILFVLLFLELLVAVGIYNVYTK